MSPDLWLARGDAIEVLLIDDDAGDILLTREALAECKPLNNVTVVNDGAQALSFLRRTGEHVAAPRPDLILLDLNLPRVGGLEVLAEIKADAGLRTIPVVVLTTSDAQRDILRSYQLHANAYVTKPLEFRRFLEVVRQIDHFFLTVGKLPGQ